MENSTIFIISSILLIFGFFIALHILLFFITRIIIFVRLLIRKRMMEKLAHEFNLDFKPNIPSFISFLKLSLYKDIQFDYIEGIYNNHSVKIHDYYHFSLKFFYNRFMRETFVEIDGNQIKGGYRSFKLGEQFLTGTDDLYLILKKLE